MDTYNSEKSTKRYTLKPSSKPLKSKLSKTEKSSKQTKPLKPSVRDANEDDDLYDPYSDIHDGTLKPLKFEEDPWK
jgi:hypothetical protein